MRKFTEKQQKFIDAKIAGATNRSAAIHAGYSEATADAASSRLFADPRIKKAVAAGKRASASTREQIEAAVGKPAEGGKDSRMKAKYQSPLDCMLDTMNNPRMPDSARLRAAEQALPYMHARVGEKGKKEIAREEAERVSGSEKKKSKFATQPPPKLYSVK